MVVSSPSPGGPCRGRSRHPLFWKTQHPGRGRSTAYLSYKNRGPRESFDSTTAMRLVYRLCLLCPRLGGEWGPMAVHANTTVATKASTLSPCWYTDSVDTLRNHMMTNISTRDCCVSIIVGPLCRFPRSEVISCQKADAMNSLPKPNHTVRILMAGSSNSRQAFFFLLLILLTWYNPPMHTNYAVSLPIPAL
jgi:hypothetical protein